MIEITRNWKGQPVTWRQWQYVSREWVKAVMPIAVAAIKINAPVYHGYSIRTPGKLRQSIAGVPVITPNSANIDITSTVPYARYVIDGAAPHIIRPRKAQMMKWMDAHGWQYATEVHHPGQRKNDFIEKAIIPLEPVFLKIYQAILIESFHVNRG